MSPFLCREADMPSASVDVRFRGDFVAEVFCPSECVRLIQDQASMRNVDSRIHSLRFDCCVFLFYSFSAVTFATKSTHCGHKPTRNPAVQQSAAVCGCAALR